MPPLIFPLHSLFPRLLCELILPHNMFVVSVFKWKSLSHVHFFATPWTVACQDPLFMELSKARILEWVAIPFSRGSSWPRGQTWVSCIAGRFFTIWATREAPCGRICVWVIPNHSCFSEHAILLSHLFQMIPELAWGIKECDLGYSVPS